jgi:hypothetical protein
MIVPRPLITSAVAIGVAVALVALQNLAIARLFPQLPRLTTDFSAAYLQRELNAAASEPPQSIFLGDSVVWGYRLSPAQTAVGMLDAAGVPSLNLAFKSGSPPNYYALVCLLLKSGVHPNTVVLQINQKVFSQSDKAYQVLYPALWTLAGPVLTQADRSMLKPPARVDSRMMPLDRMLSSVSSLYAMRTDIRETMFGEPPDPNMQQRVTPSLFEGAYDLAPLTEDNVGVRFLEKTADALRAAGIPALAFMTPTNHKLLRDYIDGPEYRANGGFLKRQLERRGVRVLDLDTAVPSNEFFDNDHMTVAGQRRLANILARALRRSYAAR